MRPLGIEGVWLWEPRVFPDERGTFHECFAEAGLRDAAGHGLHLAQANVSVSRRGVVRGVHFAQLPPGQAKYVTCVRGAVLDVAVDVRTGSPTFGRWEAVRLDDRNRRAVYLAEGLGHAFMALEDDSTVMYLCSAPYAPRREFGVDPCDPALGIAWPGDVAPVRSAKDAGAPSLAAAARAGLLPSYAACREWYAGLRGSAGGAVQ
ncbi:MULTISPECIES: dTDP-4-dehydrorhamnose 3,5-epimerase [unclassified Streptomyces]|uniref:dTDP-4-dehydrorhamnose 3,5-epimerase n=1 Tax=unclassified Streptomyces TaxID=2593676 RepID=UPI000C273705|nr:dTDP-4-dehydrorhamnose 3,5-epimerase [Streptomyces sp. CB02959]PJN40010.1 dTDP-4-dehydrorhamnose 3,5-epimerase [Streptomyces sp. CB02959]